MQRFEIRVPGSIANLGPGFDTLAVAVELYLTLRVTILAGQNQLEFDFCDCAIEGENYIERAFRFLASQRGGAHPSLRVEVCSDIPLKGGLGSSAAATVAGLRLYEAVTGPLSTQGLLNAACALEGHPDNASAALLGGLTISCQMPDRSVFAARLEWPEEVSFLVLTPKMSLSTSASRRVLPETVPLEDAVFNLQRVALFLQAVRSRDYSLLREALDDRLHQPFRKSLVPGLGDLLGLEHPDLLGVCLSGAGPSIVAFAERNLDGVEAAIRDTFAAQNLPFVIRRLKAYTERSAHGSDNAALASLPSSHS
ncbi:MAG TPA: homoserine kinase [Bryobacteraceae bacterium]|jgi:homoserine kinase|nr:homoserine kinase [Bryobacteraceae bacterium]